MKNQPTPETNSTRPMTVLSVSPLAEDYFSLKAIFNHSKRALYRADSLASALAIIRRWEVGVVVCERNLSPGQWINLGAYDVLAKPFEIRELVRSVNSAWLHWYHQQAVHTTEWTAMRAAS